MRMCCLAALGACLVLGGCSYRPGEVDAFLMKPRSPVTGKEYRILPPDVLTVTSRRVPEIDKQTQQVRPDGKINLPLVGEVVVADKTPKEVEEQITTAAKEYYEDADATVTVTGYNSQKIFVFGQVKAAGPMPWTGRDSLLDALSKAQPNDNAWPEQIIVVRGGRPRSGGSATTRSAADDKKYRKTGVHLSNDTENPREKLVINMYAMIRDGDMSNNIFLMPDDVVYVQPNPLAAAGIAMQQLFMPVQPVFNMAITAAAVSNIGNDFNHNNNGH
jgi:protein involved in polysaccharide export with SLBB domain